MNVTDATSVMTLSNELENPFSLEALAKSLIAQSAKIYVSHKKINFRLTSSR